MLAWIAALLSGAEPLRRHLRHRCRKMSLHVIVRLIKQLILVRAAQINGLRRKRRPILFKHGRDLRRRHFLRSLYGSKLRRALRHRDPLARIVLLAQALKDLDALAERFAQRLRCGFMRLWAIAPAPTLAACIPDAPAAKLACADSS
ncbi:hypothetical protein [Terricaulis sp.]|uniref:hypothetical protein n=1 Tax=Terricaulis sp. TaxID=2768686 RepID=UPI003782F5C8